MFNVEDYIEILTNLKSVDRAVDFNIEKSDYNLVTSLARQTFRGIAYTDRQYELAKIKLLDYKSQFELNGFANIEQDFNNLRMPLRELDRAKWIRVVENNSSDDLLIGIRFVFSKKLISKIENIKTKIQNHSYDANSKTHYFPLSEVNAFLIVLEFKNSNFDIAQDLLEYYGKIENMNNNKESYVPGIYSLKLENLHKKAIDYMISTHGEPSIDNLAIYNDRKDVYGLYHFDETDLQISVSKLTLLSQKIIKRNRNQVLVKPHKYNIDRIIESVLELDRFPLLVILNEKDPMQGLYQTHQAVRNIIYNESSTVLFRLDNTDAYGQEFNSYIKNNNLNNPLDSNTKIVYINNSKLPKPMIEAGFTPTTGLFIGSHMPNSKVNSYLNGIDLVIHYDENKSQFLRDKIEEL